MVATNNSRRASDSDSTTSQPALTSFRTLDFEIPLKAAISEIEKTPVAREDLMEIECIAQAKKKRKKFTLPPSS